MTIEQMVAQSGGIALVAAGLTLVIGRAEVPTKYLPLASLVSGIVVSCLLAWELTGTSILMGVIGGLMASGAYDNVQKAKELVKG